MNLRQSLLAAAIFGALCLSACGDAARDEAPPATPAVPVTPNDAAAAPAQPEQDALFEYEADRFADIRILRYRIPGFETLSLQQKQLLYYLSQAGMSGRDIMWDQNYKHNLRIRKLLEQILQYYPGDRTTAQFQSFLTYAKRVFFANGIHHHYSSDKFQPGFDAAYLRQLVDATSVDAQTVWPLDPGQDVDGLLSLLEPVLFDPSVAPKKVNTAADLDKVRASAVNFYDGVTEEEVRAFYQERIDPNDPQPVSWGLNSKLVKENGALVEKVWKVDGMYGAAIERMVYWLEQAITVAENPAQRTALERLVQYYKSGDLADFDAYNVAWVADTDSTIDVINGFIEVYNDPLGYRGSFESVVSVRDEEATRRIGAIAVRAQWFEDNSPIMDEHKKKSVVGITGKAITVVSET
ncbi:MAG TPA: hypothetical protein VNR18_08260, partial [Hyphomicrobiales bacterium]|nr:hypothetical protein [Hyphomicrobiales bacterium]